MTRTKTKMSSKVAPSIELNTDSQLAKEYEKQLAREELGQRRGEDEDRNNNNGKTDKDSAHKNGSTKNNADVEQDKENILQPKSSIPIANKQNLKAKCPPSYHSAHTNLVR